MNNLLSKLFGRNAKAVEIPKDHIPHPLEILPFNGGIIIYGTDVEENITVGLTEAPDPTDGEMREHNCIVSNVEETLERIEPNAVALLHELASLLGYEVTRP